MTERIVYLHAGLPKTGSSSVQLALFRARGRLAAAGIHYWSAAENHSWPLSLIYGEEADQSDIRDGANKRRRFGHPDEILASLRKELAGDWRKFVVSAERISSLMPNQQKALHDLVASYSDATKVIAYVREPRGWLSSIVQQKLKVGMTIEASLAKYADLPYRMRMEPLIEVYGEENVDFRLYRADWDEDGIQGDFLRAMGEDPALAAGAGEVQKNASFNAAEAAFLDRINAEIERRGIAFRRGHYARRHMAGLFRGPKFVLDEALVERIIAANREQLAWASEKVGTDLTAFEGARGTQQSVDVSPEMVTLIVRLLDTIADDRKERDARRLEREKAAAAEAALAAAE